MSPAPLAGHRAATVSRALAWARASLEAASATARLDAEVLLARVLEWSRARLLAHPGAALDPARARRFETLVERRRGGEPIAYITGRREFWSLDVAVTPDTLIPRPETEHLVEAVLGVVPADDAATVADIGTGAGAVALALGLERPRSLILGSDRSRAAVAVARANAARLGAGNVSFIVADACAALAPDRWSVIVSNPPYVAESDAHLAAGDVRFEPREALVSGPRGLTMLETLARQGPARLARGGWLVLEHGRDQGPAVRTLLSGAGLGAVETVRDLAGHERVTLGRRAPADDHRGIVRRHRRRTAAPPLVQPPGFADPRSEGTRVSGAARRTRVGARGVLDDGSSPPAAFNAADTGGPAATNRGNGATGRRSGT